MGPVPKIEASQDKLNQIKTVAVVRAPEVKTYTVWNQGHPASGLGLIGAAIIIADQTSKQNTLTKAYKDQATGVSATLTTMLASKLRDAGYIVTEQDGAWKDTDSGYSLDMNKIESDADAVLVVSPTIVGFVSPTNSTQYLPTVTSVVTLLGKDRSQPLYRGFHSAGWLPQAKGWQNTPPTTTYPDFAALMKDPKASADSLNAAAKEIAASAALALKRASTQAASD